MVAYTSGGCKQVACRDKDQADQACTQSPKGRQAGYTLVHLTPTGRLRCLPQLRCPTECCNSDLPDDNKFMNAGREVLVCDGHVGKSVCTGASAFSDLTALENKSSVGRQTVRGSCCYCHFPCCFFFFFFFLCAACSQQLSSCTVPHRDQVGLLTVCGAYACQSDLANMHVCKCSCLLRPHPVCSAGLQVNDQSPIWPWH